MISPSPGKSWGGFPATVEQRIRELEAKAAGAPFLPLGGTGTLNDNLVVDGVSGTHSLTLQDILNLAVNTTGDITLDAAGDLSAIAIDTLALEADSVVITGGSGISLLTPRVVANQSAAGYIATAQDANGRVEYNPITVANVAALKALPASSILEGWVARTLGYYTDGDGGDGLYRYNSASAATADDGAVIDPTNLTGRFLLIPQNNVLNARQFGVKGDGATDDTTRMQAAVDASAADLIPLYIPDGTYVCSSIVPKTNLRVTGAGDGTILYLKDASTLGIFYATPGTPANNVYIGHLRINGNKANCPSSGDHCRIGGSNITIEWVSVLNPLKCGMNIGYDISTNCRILHCTVTNPASASNNYGGIAFTRVFGGEISGCVVTSTEGYMTYGIDVEPNPGYLSTEVGDILISNNRIVGGMLNIDCSNLTGAAPRIVIVGNSVDNRAGKGNSTINVPPLLLANTDAAVVTGNTFIGHATSTVGSCRGAYITTSTDFTISGNTFEIYGVDPPTSECCFNFIATSSGVISGNRVIGIAVSGDSPRFLVNGQEAAGRDVRFSGNSVVNVAQAGDCESMVGPMGAKTVTNTTTETTLIGTTQTQYGGSKWVAANNITVGKSFRITVGGQCASGAGGSTLTLRFKLGSVTIASAVVTPSVSASTKMWFAQLLVTGRSAGASGTLTCFGMLYTDVAATQVHPFRGASSTTIDTTIDNDWNVTAQWGAGVDASDTISCNAFAIEPIN